MTFTVQIGNYTFNEIVQISSSDGSIISGQPNPKHISWTKENSIKTHEIPWPEYKTSRTSQKTLWKCDMAFVILTSERMKTMQNMVDEAGPYDVKTAFKSIPMYIESFTASNEEGKDDYYIDCSIKLKECRD